MGRSSRKKRNEVAWVPVRDRKEQKMQQEQ